MKLEDQILEIANAHLSDPSHFVVEVDISKSKGPKKVKILLDGDEGVNIDDCADLSRAVSNEIEEKELIETAYTMEVSSPGIDYPLSSVRQYKKNIGRKLKIQLTDDKELKGELKHVADDVITIATSKGKGKNKEKEEVEIPLSNIKKTIVQISFK